MKAKAHKITPIELKDALTAACVAIDQFCLTFNADEYPTRAKMDLMDELMIVYNKRLEDHLEKLYHFAVGVVEDEMISDEDFDS